MIWKPTKAWWIITGICNLKCKHCYIEAPNRRFGQMNLKDVMLIIDKLVNAGIKTFFFTGGEPFLRTDILDIFEYIYNRGAIIEGMDSNGTILKEKVIDFLKEKKIFINISHDGINYTKFNRVNINESIILKNIKKLTENNITTNVNSVVLPENINSLIKLFDYLKDYSINQWFLFPPFYYGNYIKNEIPELSVDQELYLYKIIYQKWQAANKPFHIRLGNLFDSAKTAVPWKHYICEYFRDYITIFPDGKVTPCCKYIAHKDFNNFPNILEEPFEKILYHPLLQFYKNLDINNIFKFNSECESCKFWDHCNGGCRMDVYIKTGEIYKKDNRLCELMHKSEKFFRNEFNLSTKSNT